MAKIFMALVMAVAFAIPALAGDCKEGCGCAKAKSDNNCAERIKNADADGDGKVSKEEFWGDDAEFAKYDSNKDGYITAGEMSACEKGDAKDCKGCDKGCGCGDAKGCGDGGCDKAAKKAAPAKKAMPAKRGGGAANAGGGCKSGGCGCK